MIELARQRSELAQRWTTKQRFLQDGDCARTYGLFGNGMIGCARQQDRCKMRAEIPGKSDEGDAADSRQAGLDQKETLALPCQHVRLNKRLRCRKALDFVSGRTEQGSESVWLDPISARSGSKILALSQ